MMKAIGTYQVWVDSGHYEEKMERFADGTSIQSRTWVADGHKRVWIEVSVDAERIAKKLGRRAVRNKSGAAIVLGGAVKVAREE